MKPTPDNIPDLGPEAMPEAASRNAQTINKWLRTWMDNMKRSTADILERYDTFGNINADISIPEWFRT